MNDTSKAAIVVLADPDSGSDEALGRVFNALAAAWDLQTRGKDVTILFQGAGARWPGHLADSSHPAHDLFASVSDCVAGVSAGCAAVFGGAEEARDAGMELLGDNAVPGTQGLPSLGRLLAEGHRVLTF